MLRAKEIFLILFCFLPLGCLGSNYASSGFSQGLVAIKLGENNLEDVQKIYGNAKIATMGDASKSQSYVCYTFTQNDIKQVVLFGSDNELAGKPDYLVTRVELYRSDVNPYKNIACQETSSGNLTSLIGKNKQKFADAFGVGLETIVDDYKHSSCYKKNIKKTDSAYDYWKGREGCFGSESEPYYDICFTLEAGFKDGLLSYVVLTRSETVC